MKHSQLTHTHSVLTVYHLNYWITDTEDDRLAWGVSALRRHGLHIAAVIPKQPWKSALPFSLWLAPIVFCTAFLPAIVSNLFLFSLWQVDAFDKGPHAHTFTITVTDEPEANNMTRK